jgi:spermidine/putrescine transport system permease protein
MRWKVGWPTFHLIVGVFSMNRRRWLLAPGAAWLLLFFNLPLAIVLFISLVERGRAGGIQSPPVFTLQNYLDFFDPLYLGIFWHSLRIGLLVTAGCVLVGYPLAYFIARQRPAWRTALLLLVMIPFWTNFLVRTYALKQVLGTDGLVNSALLALGSNRPAAGAAL